MLDSVLLPDAPLTDGRILLRPWQPGDADWYAATARDAEIRRWTTEPDGLTAAVVREAIERMHAGREHAGMAVTDAATGQLLGNAGLAPAAEPGVGEISYWLAPHARGQGAATRAVRLLVDWAWRCGLHRVQLHTHVDNLASQRVAENAGFVRDRVVPAYRVVKGEVWDAVFYVLDRPG